LKEILKEESFHGAETPSPWVQRWSHLIVPGGTVLDVACGYGRHVRWFHQRNHPVVAVDRAQNAIDFIVTSALACEAVVADIENGPWPFEGRKFDAVVVTNYLWRPLVPVLLGSLSPGGVLIYETFAQGNETVGKPSRPDFLLRSGELLGICNSLRIIAFEDGFQEGGQDFSPRFVQRIAAVREPATPLILAACPSLTTTSPPRYPLL